MDKLFPTKIKICGVQSSEIVDEVVRHSIDYIGFVFAKSKRRVNKEQVKPWVEKVHHYIDQGVNAPKTVGVFVNPSFSELHEIITHTKLDVVQLHGNESVDLCKQIKQYFDVQIMKTFPISSVDSHRQLDAIIQQCGAYEKVIDLLLLDTFDPIYGGGSGETFAWDRIPPYQIWCQQVGIELFIAGGLKTENVEELIEKFHPHGVDISSGVETNGIKDKKKISQFIERVSASGRRT